MKSVPNTAFIVQHWHSLLQIDLIDKLECEISALKPVILTEHEAVHVEK